MPVQSLLGTHRPHSQPIHTNAGDIGAGVDGVGDDDEFDMVGDVVGDVLIFIAFPENNRPADDKSRGSIGSISRSRSISHFRLERKIK